MRSVGDLDFEGAAIDEQLAIPAHQFGLEEVHRRGADEAGHEQVIRAVIQRLRGIDLLQEAFVDHRDAGGHGHGFHLVVGHVDKGGLQLLVQLADVGAGFNAQLGIQVGQRLVEQENLRLAHDGPADCHALALTTGELAGLAVQQVANAQDLGCLPTRRLISSFGVLRSLRPKAMLSYTLMWGYSA